MTQKVRFLYGNYKNHMESLILAQNERWRRGLGMQVEREGTAMFRKVANG
jgi:hypothetical protein